MKCELCKKDIEQHFLGKLKGTYVRVKGKMKAVCPECQAKHEDVKSKVS